MIGWHWNRLRSPSNLTRSFVFGIVRTLEAGLIHCSGVNADVCAVRRDVRLAELICEQGDEDSVRSGIHKVNMSQFREI